MKAPILSIFLALCINATPTTIYFGYLGNYFSLTTQNTPVISGSVGAGLVTPSNPLMDGTPYWDTTDPNRNLPSYLTCGTAEAFCPGYDLASQRIWQNPNGTADSFLLSNLGTVEVRFLHTDFGIDGFGVIQNGVKTNFLVGNGTNNPATLNLGLGLYSMYGFRGVDGDPFARVTDLLSDPSVKTSFVVDVISASATPEPATLFMCGAALIGLAMFSGRGMQLARSKQT